jgi:hypothetical protein
MDTLVKVNADELNNSLIDFIKASFKGKKIAVHIYEDEMDETEYLLNDTRHRAELLEAVEAVKQGNIKGYTMTEIKEMIK